MSKLSAFTSVALATVLHSLVLGSELPFETDFEAPEFVSGFLSPNEISIGSMPTRKRFIQ
jgi:hypothetical protein